MTGTTRLVAALLAASASVLPAIAGAQDYPTRPVKMIVPFAAGGPADIYARLLGQKLQDTLGQNFVVENNPGGGAVIGAAHTGERRPGKQPRGTKENR